MRKTLVNYLDTIKDVLTNVTSVEGFCTRRATNLDDGNMLCLLVVDTQHYFVGTISTNENYVSIELLNGKYRVLWANAGSVRVVNAEDISDAIYQLEEFVEMVIEQVK